MSKQDTQEHRRELLTGLGLASLALLASPGARSTGGAARNEHVIVKVFLRGGCDGLNMVIPHGDAVYGEQYRNLRPRLAIPAPDDQSAAPEERSLELGGGFALHPSLQGLHEIFTNDDGDIAFVHAVGPMSPSRSHFSAQAMVERGWDGGDGPRTGWLGRYIEHMHGGTASLNTSAFRAVAIGGRMPVSLFGAGRANSMMTIDEFAIWLPSALDESQVIGKLEQHYATPGALDAATNDLIGGVRLMDEVRPTVAEPASGLYPEGNSFAGKLKEAAKIIKTGARLGTEVITLDIPGWDTHARQAGTLTTLLRELGDGLKAFYDDLKQAGLKHKVSTVVMSEFGRRVAENGSQGTDHGSGGCMLVLGGGVQGGVYYDRWLPLDPDAQAGQEDSGLIDIGGRRHRGDLMATLDYRDVLSEVIQHAAPNADLDAIFNAQRSPGSSPYQPTPVGLYQPGAAKVSPTPRADKDEGELVDDSQPSEALFRSGGGLL